jgi:uncharacterized membrane protein
MGRYPNTLVHILGALHPRSGVAIRQLLRKLQSSSTFKWKGARTIITTTIITTTITIIVIIIIIIIIIIITTMMSILISITMYSFIICIRFTRGSWNGVWAQEYKSIRVYTSKIVRF